MPSDMLFCRLKFTIQPQSLCDYPNTNTLMDALPEYIDRRIRRPIPNRRFRCLRLNTRRLVRQLPHATVATLGLNPSRVEFLDRNGNILTGADRRLATHESLGTGNLTDASADVIAEVLQDCDAYFTRNPYRRWFDQLEIVLNQCRASYYNGTACHLDLVQWATDPTWGRLQPKAVRQRLLDADTSFLSEQLSHENILVLLVNGSDGMIRQLKRSLNVNFAEHDPITGYR